MCIYMTVEYSLFSCNSIANSIISLHFLTLGTLVLIRWGPTHLQNIVVGKYHPSLKQSERVLRHPMVHRTFEWINTNMSMVKTWKMAWTVDLANSNGWLPWQPSKINMRFCFHSHDLHGLRQQWRFWWRRPEIIRGFPAFLEAAKGLPSESHY